MPWALWLGSTQNKGALRVQTLYAPQSPSYLFALPFTLPPQTQHGNHTGLSDLLLSQICPLGLSLCCFLSGLLSPHTFY